MKHPSASLAMSAILAGAFIISPAFAVVNIDYVTVGNPGNEADDSTGSIYGAVAYAYKIGTYEVTNAEYAAFLNAVDPSGANARATYSSYMGTDARGGITYTAGAASGAKYTIRSNMGNKPVNYVSWYDAARFSNWLHNGQGNGSTETGAYTLNGDSGIITKNVEATVWLSGEDEWYKAAYYDPTKNEGAGGYWVYPTQSDILPTVAAANTTGGISNPGTNVANYALGADWNSLDGNLTAVGSATSDSYYGTFDQGGNLWEWNDAIVSGAARGLRGGAWDSIDPYGGDYLRSSARNPTLNGNIPSFDSPNVGFRVASIPEPASIVVTMLASGMLMVRRRR